MRDIQGGSDLGDIFAGSIPDVIGKPVYSLRYPTICSATYPAICTAIYSATFPLTGGTPGKLHDKSAGYFLQGKALIIGPIAPPFLMPVYGVAGKRRGKRRSV